MVTQTDHKTMKPIHHATSLGPDVHAWMTNSHAPRILNVFDLASNLINERGEVMSLVSQEVGNGPFNLMISAQSSGFVFDQVVSGSPIAICWPQLVIGHVVIDTRRANFWNAKPNWADLFAKKELVLSDLISHIQSLISLSHPDSLLSLLLHSALIPDHPLVSYSTRQDTSLLGTPQPITMITGWMNTLFEAVHSIDLESCREVAQNLAGLGQGLTPAGDDFLLGAMYAARIIHPQEKAERITSTIASTAIPLTTSLSAAWIQAAVRGLVNEPWLDFLEGWKIPGQPTNESSLRKLLSIGHTSGADALAGFIGCITYGKTRPDLKTIAELQNEYKISGRTIAVPLWD